MFDFFQPADIPLHDYWVHIAEVLVQFTAVVLLLLTVNLARRANRTATEALTEAKQDLAAERAEYARAMSNQRYDALDKTYMDLVLLRVQYPDFNDPNRLYAMPPTAAEDEAKRRYESYAFALFNFLETIADKCHDEIVATPTKNSPVGLVETWGPVLLSECRQHQRWFHDEANLADERFKKAFRTLVRKIVDADPTAGNQSIDAADLLRASYD